MWFTNLPFLYQISLEMFLALVRNLTGNYYGCAFEAVMRNKVYQQVCCTSVNSTFSAPKKTTILKQGCKVVSFIIYINNE